MYTYIEENVGCIFICFVRRQLFDLLYGRFSSENSTVTNTEFPRALLLLLLPPDGLRRQRLCHSNPFESLPLNLSCQPPPRVTRVRGFIFAVQGRVEENLREVREWRFCFPLIDTSPAGRRVHRFLGPFGRKKFSKIFNIFPVNLT